MGRNIRITVDLGTEKHMKVRELYAEYDSFTNTIKGFGEASSSKFKAMEYEPVFEAVLYDKKNRICDTVVATYNGVFTKTGKMVFRFEFSEVSEFNASRIKLMLIAKPVEQIGTTVKFS